MPEHTKNEIENEFCQELYNSMKETIGAFIKINKIKLKEYNILDLDSLIKTALILTTIDFLIFSSDKRKISFKDTLSNFSEVLNKQLETGEYELKKMCL